MAQPLSPESARLQKQLKKQEEEQRRAAQASEEAAERRRRAEEEERKAKEEETRAAAEATQLREKLEARATKRAEAQHAEAARAVEEEAASPHDDDDDSMGETPAASDGDAESTAPEVYARSPFRRGQLVQVPANAFGDDYAAENPETVSGTLIRITSVERDEAGTERRLWEVQYESGPWETDESFFDAEVEPAPVPPSPIKWRTEGHPLIGSKVTHSKSQGTVVGWLQAAESDFLDAAGQPAALYLTKYTVGELAGSEFTCALHEVEEALVETVERTAVKWTGTEDQKTIIKELRDSELKKPDGARTSHQLAAKAVSLKLFRKPKQGAIQTYISRAALVSEENKDMTHRVASHALQTLASLEAKDATAREGQFIVANAGLMCVRTHSTNNHPRNACLVPVYVRIKNGGSAKDVAEATEKALCAAIAVRSYHKAHGQAQLDELADKNPTRYAEVMKYRKKFDDQTTLKVDDGWCASGIEGVARTKRHGKPDLLEVVVKGPYYLHQREDTEQGRAEIEVLVLKSDSDVLLRRRVLADAAEALASGLKTYERLLAERGISFVLPDERKPGAAAAKRERPVVPEGAPPRRQPPPPLLMSWARAKPAQKNAWARSELDGALETAAAARQCGVGLVASSKEMELYDGLWHAYYKQDASLCRPTEACYNDCVAPTLVALRRIVELAAPGAPRFTIPFPAQPATMVGMFKGSREELLPTFRLVELELSVEAAALTDATQVRKFVEVLDCRLKETSVFKTLASSLVGVQLTDEGCDRLKPVFCFDLLLDFDDNQCSVPVPEGVVLWPTTFSKRWRGRVLKSEWKRYVGSGRLGGIAMVVGAESMKQRGFEKAGVLEH